jgi:hypothetical protein
MRTNSAHVGERAHPPHEMVVDAQLDLAADLQRGSQKHVQRVIDGALARVLDGHDAEVGDAAFHFMKHLVDRRQRERAYRGTEVLEHGRLRESAFGAQERDLERLLLGEAGGHDLAEQPCDFLIAQRPAIARERLAQNLRLALGAVEIDRFSAR